MTDEPTNDPERPIRDDRWVLAQPDNLGFGLQGQGGVLANPYFVVGEPLVDIERGAALGTMTFAGSWMDTSTGGDFTSRPSVPREGMVWRDGRCIDPGRRLWSAPWLRHVAAEPMLIHEEVRDALAWAAAEIDRLKGAQ